MHRQEIRKYIEEHGAVNSGKFKKHCTKKGISKCHGFYKEIVFKWDRKHSPSKDWWFEKHGNKGRKLKWKKLKKEKVENENEDGEPAQKKRKYGAWKDRNAKQQKSTGPPTAAGPEGPR